MLHRQQAQGRIGSAFTLIEILIVVVILAILATVGIVMFGSASKEAREAVLKEELRFMRTQLALYRASHANAAGIDPASGNPDESVLVAQLTMSTDFYGNTAAERDATHTFPPYLSSFPKNPFLAENADRIKFVASSEGLSGAVDESTGWIYCPQTLEFVANSIEYGPNGKAW